MYLKRWLFYCTVSGNNGALTFVCYNSLDLLDWLIISYNIKNRALSLSPSISRSSFLYFHTLITTFVTKKQELETMWRSLNIISVAGSLKKEMWCRLMHNKTSLTWTDQLMFVHSWWYRDYFWSWWYHYKHWTDWWWLVERSRSWW